MARNTRAASNFMQPFKQSDGSGADYGSDTAATGRGFYALVGGPTVYVIELGGVDTSPLESVQFRWNAALAGTLTIESSNLAPKDATIIDTDATKWLQENPSTSGITVVGAGNSISGLTVTLGGTNAGGVLLHLGNMGSARLRAKISVTTAGVLQTTVMGKPT